MVSIFFSYSHKDETLRNELETHLAMLRNEGAIDTWHDRRIVAGDEVDATIDAAIDEAQVILLLASPDFLASRYCYGKEVKRAMQRHESREARVVPVILRPCEWQRAPFGKLRATPSDGLPVTKWPNIDDAFLDVTRDIRRAIESTAPTTPSPSSSGVHAEGTVIRNEPRSTTGGMSVQAEGTVISRGPRSSNLRVRQEFTEADKDRFLDEAFEYTANFFENSMKELASRYSGIQIKFERIDARRFAAVLYRNGKAQSRCRVVLRGPHNGIAYATNDTGDDSTANEILHVQEGEQMLFLRSSFGAARMTGSADAKEMTFEGAAEYLWRIFINRIQS